MSKELVKEYYEHVNREENPITRELARMKKKTLTPDNFDDQ